MTTTPKSNRQIMKGVTLLSSTMPPEQIETMFTQTEAYTPSGHFQFPMPVPTKDGSHLSALFVLSPITRHPEMVDWVAEDVVRWVKQEQLQFDVIFAPAQASVITVVRAIAAKLNKRVCFWEFLESGWFGTQVVEGSVNPGDRVLIYNGVSQTGNCINNRLPGFVEELGGTIEGCAVFARGNNEGNKAAEKRFGTKLHTTVEVDIPVTPAAQCTVCKQPSAPPVVPWTDKERAE